ncbi:hypothetical protein PC128_g16481 [Phytophthora cactorum]|nr:hypothetical protein PC128_g16481 [Phytophthora cactorum]
MGGIPDRSWKHQFRLAVRRGGAEIQDGGGIRSRDTTNKPRSQVNQRLREAIADWVDRHNDDVQPHQIQAGSQVWLYLDRVKEGYARKLAQLCHGPFRVADKIGEHAIRLETGGTEYRLFPVVHVSKLMLVKEYPDRPRARITINDSDRVDFGENLLPEDSWTCDLDRTSSRRSPACDLASGQDTAGSTVNFWFTGDDMKIRAG